jgi:hypothetical protein
MIIKVDYSFFRNYDFSVQVFTLFKKFARRRAVKSSLRE